MPAAPPTHTLLALDPGLTATGWAVIRWPGGRVADLTTLRPCLLDAGIWRPPGGASAPIEQRATWLVARATDALRGTTGPWYAAIEVPPVARQYARYASRDRSGRGHLNLESSALHREIVGWLAGGLCSVATVVRMPATGRKQHRAALVRTIWPALARAGEHLTDAIYLAVRLLTDERRHWQEAPPPEET